MIRLLPIAFAVATLGFAGPAAAQDYGYDYNGYEDQHHAEHDQLNHERKDLHHRLRDEHGEAHDQGLDPWEHGQLHRDLRAEHRYQDQARRYEHYREHEGQQSRGYYENRHRPYGY